MSTSTTGTRRTKSPTRTITGTVQALCGCVGVVKDSGTRLTGPFPVVSVVVTAPCRAGHPETVGSGVTCRFPPHGVINAKTLEPVT